MTNPTTTEIPRAAGAEWKILEAMARMTAGDDGADEAVARFLADPAFRWGALLEIALRNKLQGLLAHMLLEESYREVVPDRLKSWLFDMRALNRQRIRLYADEAAAVARRLEAEGVPAALRKGLLFEHLLYGGRGLRVFSDMDLLVFPEDRGRAARALAEFGYEIGDYDLHHDRILPHERRTLITYRLNPDHAPRMVRATGDPVVRYLEVDIACSLTWTRSEYEVPLGPAMARRGRLTLPSAPEGVPVLAPEYVLVDGIMHLFREAFVESSLAAANAVALSGFLDVLLLWRWYRREHDPAVFTARVVELGLEAPAAWVLAHVDRLLGSRTVEEAGLASHADDAWLATLRRAGGGSGSWHGDMRARLERGESIQHLTLAEDGG